MSGKMVYFEILKILKEHYDKDPPYFVPSSELRSLMNTPVDELRPYAENLEMNGYVYKEEGISPTTFLLKIRHKGIEALKTKKIRIQKECRLHGGQKLKILEVLKGERDRGNIYYVPKRQLLEGMGLSAEDGRLIAEEMEYCGLARMIESNYPNFTMQITDKGLEYLRKRRG